MNIDISKATLAKFAGSTQGATLLAGAAMAGVIGIMLGGAMRPQLIVGDRALGPQMQTASGGPRSDDTLGARSAYASYSGVIPTYVIGTDSLKTTELAAEPEEGQTTELAATDAATDAAAIAPAAISKAAYETPNLPAVIYPSEAGGATYGEQVAASGATAGDDQRPTITY